ncbi:MAG TPA: NAD-dependent epimerase/dehydratase family protein [Vicinamibacterales bacterium]|nr:NAD-dependent epimerase/dehydratase family protein [Vicinamibacterales bacterium]
MTQQGIFVTGGTGFVGRRLLPLLAGLDRPMAVLVRGGSAGLPHDRATTLVTGDLLAPETYRDALRTCGVVIHLAAATGRASAQALRQVNVDGTRALLGACRDANVSRVLFVSSIAATFPSEARYPYAEAKRAAERLVSDAGIPFTIVRPTIILGPDAPILSSLSGLARLPIVVLPGDGRVRVQPIHVDDVAARLLRIVRDDEFGGETIELGGPETTTMEELVQEIRCASGRPAGRVIHVPLGLLAVPLRAAEAIGLGSVLPITAAQLSSFRYEGVATRPGRRSSETPLTGLASMVGGAPAPAGNAFTPSPALPGECRVFTRYLLGRNPDAYVQAKYTQALAAVPALAPRSRFDEVLIRFAGRGPFAARLADSYASLFQPGSALRKRLVLLLAILETHPPFSTQIDRAPGSASRAAAGIVAHGMLGALSLVAGLLLFLPVRIVRGGIPRKTS